MADTIPLRYAQSLLKLTPMSEDQLREELVALNMPLVLLQSKGATDARIPVDDYGRLFIHLVHKLPANGFGLDRAGPAHDERHAMSALPNVGLVAT